MDDRGSVLFVYVAGVLVVLVLGAIAADLSHVYMARRDLIEQSGTLANDISTAGIDQQHFRAAEEYVLDTATSARIARTALTLTNTGSVTASLTPVSDGQPAGTNLTLVDDRDQPVTACNPTVNRCRVRVTLYAHVPYIFGRGLPGDRGADLRATSYATLEEGSG